MRACVWVSVCVFLRAWLASVTAMIWAADTDAPCRPMRARGWQKGEGRVREADLTPFVVKDLMSWVQIKATAGSARTMGSEGDKWGRNYRRCEQISDFTTAVDGKQRGGRASPCARRETDSETKKKKNRPKQKTTIWQSCRGDVDFLRTTLEIFKIYIFFLIKKYIYVYSLYSLQRAQEEDESVFCRGSRAVHLR